MASRSLMLSTLLLFLSTFALSIPLQTQTCPKTFDGRIPQNFTKQTFTTAQNPFNPKYVLGHNQTWDQVIDFPDVPSSIFDSEAGTKPVEVELTDASVFVSGSEGRETALRRAELLVNNKNQTVSGKVTWMFSMRTSPSPSLALNLSHEYLLAFHEAQDFQADFWSLKVGLPMQEALRGPNGEVLYLQGYKWAQPMQTYFMAPFTRNVWHNFGLYLDFVDNKMQIAYSTGAEKLEIVTPLLANNISGTPPTTLGETHFGLQKRPVGANITNFLFNGFQPEGIRERLVVGGVLQFLLWVASASRLV
ncbi:glycoside hydrolase family 131 protein [Periconia macrospinosa]|uniref:Glycoside hydrolase family 131 protein n=1 Tax=Periconia macrospinosa TaxID=97972 RepID=A0A2V1DPX9_9PLEO|nr:glycoside hydrolase family 131 protein [Periconia macrospinosa]